MTLTEKDFEGFCSKHKVLKDKISAVAATTRLYSVAMKDARAREEELINSLADLYNTGVENELLANGADLSKMHSDDKVHRRTHDLLKRFATTPFGAGADTTSAADFASNLMDGLASGVTSQLVAYQREMVRLNALIEGYENKRNKYNHYVTKLTTLSQKAASEEDGMEAAKISAKLARNMEKLKNATHSNDEALVVVCGELQAATSIKGVKGRMDPMLDRIVQFFGLIDGSHLENVVMHQAEFGKTRGVLGSCENEDSGSDTDSDTDDEAYAEEEIDTEEEEEGFEVTHTHKNYLRQFKPRYKSLTRFMPREKPKHFDGFLNVRQEKKLLSSRNYCILKGDILEGYNNETEPLFGSPPIFEILVKNVTEWEQKAPNGLIVEDGYAGKRVFLKSDAAGEKWLKACLRASCWDEGRSRMNILNTLKKVKTLTEGTSNAAKPVERVVGGGGGVVGHRKARALRTRSSAPMISNASSGEFFAKKKKRTPSYSSVPIMTEQVKSSPSHAPKRRPSYNPFGSSSGSSPVVIPSAVGGKRQFAGGLLMEDAGVGGGNPFDEDDILESTDEEEEGEGGEGGEGGGLATPPMPPKLNPFNSSYNEEEEEEEKEEEGEERDFSMIDDFIALSENGTISYEAFMNWDEMKTAIESGDITEEEISLQWLETEGGAGSGIDQNQFGALVKKLEKVIS
ncbi:hypothetical protein TrLO_g14663 [Triparma laevis f. longispina]|uniref:PH domain-containing protein n=1 Tax=Triparma laevis f. longispina TaxID=1714387 RepID=A0A9W7L0X1_9STRA|nr:hypothetical protein TrLO_g14663 [Triparma laevis f. longispina]